jgi:peroxin-14
MMAPREDLVASAVTFLQDPSVASAPVDKRVEFLKSKNLTQEEIDLSLARAAGDVSPSAYNPPPPSQNAPYYPPPAQYPARGPPGQRYPYPYNPYGEYPPPPPPEPPRRDWRDYFILATVVTGASYGLYVLAQRYVKPLIAPPTPPQLEQDKAAIDEQFNKAFALLDTLSSDTAALKEAEEKRTERLDSAITDIEAIVSDLKAANTRREDDARRMEAEIKTMKESLPRSIDGVKEASERQLKELGTELGSLKLLMGNRIGSTAGSSSGGAGAFGPAGQGIPRTQPGTFPGSAAGSAAQTPSTEGVPQRPTPGYSNSSSALPTASSLPSTSATSRPTPPTTFSNSGTRAAIPAWQMAAQNKATAKDISPAAASHGSNVPVTNGSSSSSQQPVDGAEVVGLLNAS